jgi:hypothetical protein
MIVSYFSSVKQGQYETFHAQTIFFPFARRLDSKPLD